MAIETQLNGTQLDRILQAFLNVQKAENNGRILYITKGELFAENGNVLFNVIGLEEVED